MAVMIYGNESTVHGRYDDGESGHWSYKVLSSGVLQLLTTDAEMKWLVSAEFSPSAWKKVEGTRFIADTERASGAAGFAPQRASEPRRATVL